MLTMSHLSRYSFSSGKIGTLKFTERLGAIQALLGKKVRIYQATTLNEVSLDEATLKCLEKQLVNQMPGCTEVSISVLDNEDYFPPSISVECLSNSQKKKQKLYKCIFISVSSNRPSNQNSVKLPLLCVLSGGDLVDSVHPILESTFGCIITSINMEQNHIKWLLGISINELIRREFDTGISLDYEIKTGMNFCCNLPYGELYYLWKMCIKSDSEKLMCDELERFIDVFITHFENAYKIKVSWFKMIRMSLDKMELSNENEVLIKSSIAQLLYCVLSFMESDIVCIHN